MTVAPVAELLGNVGEGLRELTQLRAVAVVGVDLHPDVLDALIPFARRVGLGVEDLLGHGVSLPGEIGEDVVVEARRIECGHEFVVVGTGEMLVRSQERRVFEAQEELDMSVEE